MLALCCRRSSPVPSSVQLISQNQTAAHPGLTWPGLGCSGAGRPQFPSTVQYSTVQVPDSITRTHPPNDKHKAPAPAPRNVPYFRPRLVHVACQIVQSPSLVACRTRLRGPEADARTPGCPGVERTRTTNRKGTCNKQQMAMGLQWKAEQPTPPQHQHQPHHGTTTTRIPS